MYEIFVYLVAGFLFYGISLWWIDELQHARILNAIIVIIIWPICLISAFTFINKSPTKYTKIVIVGLSLFFLLITMSIAIAKDFVATELVLLADISASMDKDERRLQREGYWNAFFHEKVIEAIQTNGSCACAYVEYATKPFLVVPFTRIETEEEIKAFGEAILNGEKKATFGTNSLTGIANAVRYAMLIIDSNEYEGRKVIDVSSDGFDNVTRDPEVARDEAQAQGFTINGLPIVIPQKPGEPWKQPKDILIKYYKDKIITTNGKIYPADSMVNLGESIIDKLSAELM